MHEDRVSESSHTVFLGYWGYGELKGRGIIASNVQLIKEIRMLHSLRLCTMCIVKDQQKPSVFAYTLCYKK